MRTKHTLSHNVMCAESQSEVYLSSPVGYSTVNGTNCNEKEI